MMWFATLVTPRGLHRAGGRTARRPYRSAFFALPQKKHKRRLELSFPWVAQKRAGSRAPTQPQVATHSRHVRHCCVESPVFETRYPKTTSQAGVAGVWLLSVSPLSETRPSRARGGRFNGQRNKFLLPERIRCQTESLQPASFRCPKV